MLCGVVSQIHFGSNLVSRSSLQGPDHRPLVFAPSEVDRSPQVQGMSLVLTCLAASSDTSSCSEPELQVLWPRDIGPTGVKKEDMVAVSQWPGGLGPCSEISKVRRTRCSPAWRCLGSCLEERVWPGHLGKLQRAAWSM